MRSTYWQFRAVPAVLAGIGQAHRVVERLIYDCREGLFLGRWLLGVDELWEDAMCNVAFRRRRFIVSFEHFDHLRRVTNEE